MHSTAGKMGFLDLRSGNCHPNLKMRVLKKRPKFISWARPTKFLCSFLARLYFSQKTGFQNRPILAETTVNVVPKWRGQKRNFCAEGTEIGHLRVGSKMVPKYFSLHSTSFPIHLQEDKENCLIFFCLFPSWQQVPFYHFNDLIFCCAISTWRFYHGSRQFFCVLVGCVCSFLLVPLLLIILHHSFFSLFNFVLLFFFLLSFFFGGCMSSCYCVFLFLLLFYSFSCVSFSSSPMLLCFSSFLSCFFACISFDCFCITLGQGCRKLCQGCRKDSQRCHKLCQRSRIRILKGDVDVSQDFSHPQLLCFCFIPNGDTRVSHRVSALWYSSLALAWH